MDYFKKRKPLSDEELQKRIASLPPELQAQFLLATDMLLQKESTIFLDVIQDSRNEINDINQEIKSDKTLFRGAVSRLDKFEEEQSNSAKLANDKLNEFVEKRQKLKKNINLNFQPDKEKEAVENYLKAVGRHKEDDGSFKVEIPSYARSATSGSNTVRPGTAFKIRMEDTSASIYVESSQSNLQKAVIINVDPTVNKQQEELINRLKEQETQEDPERERQKKNMEKRKADRQNKKIDSDGVRAANMIDKSKGVDEKQLQTKMQQEKTILERLEKMKVNKNISPVHERSSTILVANSHQSRNSLFEESRKELSIRPRTGESKSPAKTPECIELRTPVKSGWNESVGSQKDIAAMFEINEQYHQQDHEEKKLKKKKHRKKHTDETKMENNGDIEIVTLGE